MSTKTDPNQPILSGFCNPSNPPDSHARCRKPDCPCTSCGHGEVVERLTPPCRCWTQRALPHEGHCCMRGDAECHQVEGLALYAAAQTTVGEAS